MDELLRQLPRFDAPTGHAIKPSRAAARVRAAAVEAFSELGFHGTTTREIAARLELSTAAIYPHYSSKQSLLYDIVLEAHAAAYASLTALPLAGSLTARERLEAATAALSMWHARNSMLARVANFEMRALSAEQLEHIHALRRRTSAFFRAIIEEGGVRGEFRSDGASAITQLITSMCVDVCRWYPSKTHNDVDALGAFYADAAVRIVINDDPGGRISALPAPGDRD
ncbi:TetR/AcrR family transcriptional regulator [Dietzia sp. PP-33]|uniref:TetR/AcrR family transcriptional regulator n=1 Tax=Dietzia sp. PP-33 TaxID=2957500 RepID=UPI0029B88981|nr:TetR/AcrR family transcriptional regulator [Dietzia sp. PP-33]MDX2358980.1 TetR/AcrR family transcriptional regulator [Dietzia sp. PP-33]